MLLLNAGSQLKTKKQTNKNIYIYRFQEAASNY